MPGIQGAKGQRGKVLEIGVLSKPERGDVGDAGYPGKKDFTKLRSFY
jgi:hypothetical protein